MSLTTLAAGLAKRLSAADPNTLADFLRLLDFGGILRRQRVTLRRQNPNGQAAGVASSYNLATLQVLVLPDDAKAASIVRCYARAGTGTTGELTPGAPNSTPLAHTPAVTPNGDIGFLATDAYTDLDVLYEVLDQDVFELGSAAAPFVVAANQLLLPAAYAGTAGAGSPNPQTANAVNQAANAVGVQSLLEVEVFSGTVTGKKIVLAPGSAPAAGQACLDVTKTKVLFQATDGVTGARVKFGCFKGTTPGGTADVNALLEQVPNL